MWQCLTKALRKHILHTILKKNRMNATETESGRGNPVKVNLRNLIQIIKPGIRTFLIGKFLRNISFLFMTHTLHKSKYNRK